MAGLTDKQQRFVDEYCIDFNATQAAVRAGYSKKTASIIGWENLRKPNISKAVKEYVESKCMTSEEALMRLASFARGDIGDFIRHNNGGDITLHIPDDKNATSLLKKVKVSRTTRTDSEGRALEDEKIEFEMQDQQAAIDKILKAAGAYNESLTLKGDDGQPIVIRFASGENLIIDDGTTAA